MCDFDALVPDVGVRALLGDDQVALFRLSGTDDVYAVDAFDPFSGAPVLSRGIVGDVGGELVVASPIYKQHFSLRTGRCLEDPAVTIRTFPARVVGGEVQVRHGVCHRPRDGVPGLAPVQSVDADRAQGA